MIIYRYLTKEIYTSLFATTIVLLLIFISQQLVQYLRLAATGDISPKIVALLLLLKLPLLLALLLPLSLFLAIILAYGRLYADNEITIMQSAGIGQNNLLRINIRFSIIITIIVAALSLWVGPTVSNYSDHLLSGAAPSSMLELVLPNRFTPIAKGKWIFYVDAASKDKKDLHHVFAAEQPDEKNLNSNTPLGIVSAAGGHPYTDKSTGDSFLVLTNGYRYSGTPGTNNYRIAKYDEYGVRIQQETVWQQDESNTSTWELWQARAQRLAATELQWRIALPLSAFILTLLGTPLSCVKPKKGRYAKIAPAALCYIIYANLLFLARAWLKKGFIVPLLGMWWVHGAMLLLAIFWLTRQGKKKF